MENSVRELTFEEVNQVSCGLTWTEVAAGMQFASTGPALAAYWTSEMPPLASFLAAGAIVTGLTGAGIDFELSMGYATSS